MSEIKVDALSTVSGSGNLTVDTDTLVIDTTNEKIGINQASPTYQLTVKAATQSTVEIESASTTGESRLYFTDPDSTGTGEVGYYHNGDTMRFATGGVERMRLSSAGLHIGGTGSANALDDYEEGTFTPSFTQGVNAGASYTAQSGRYTKIGRQVIAEVDLDLNSYSANGSHVFVGGFPFVSNSAAPYGGGFFNYNGGWYNSLGQWLMIANAQYAAFYRQSDGGAMGGTSSGINMGGSCRFVLLYMTA